MTEKNNTKKGYWEQGDIYDIGDVCSECGYDSFLEPCNLSYCPSCHAEMEIKSDNERVGAAMKATYDRLKALEAQRLKVKGIRTMKTKHYICPKCGTPFEITSFWKWLNAPHMFDIWRYIKCPHCGKRSWVKKIKR